MLPVGRVVSDHIDLHIFTKNLFAQAAFWADHVFGDDRDFKCRLIRDGIDVCSPNVV